MKPEHILVIPATDLPEPSLSLIQNDNIVTDLFATNNGSFMQRDAAERDPSFKQIIPYITFMTKDQRVLVYERGKSGGEDRLHAKLSVGAGGHINDTDGEAGVPAFINASRRELVEEVGMAIPPQVILAGAVGLLHHNEDQVGSVHAGVSIILICNDDTANELLGKCEAEMVNPQFVSLADLEAPETFERLETWARMVVKHLLVRAGDHAKWTDPAFRERVGFLAVSAGNLASAASGFLLQESPRGHMMSRQMVEMASGEVQCMIAGLIHNGDIGEEQVKGAAMTFRDELQGMLKHQQPKDP